MNFITLFTINKDHTTKFSSNTQQSLKMNVLTTIKDGDSILRASGRFANDERTVSLNNFTGETWFHLRQHGTGIQKSFSMRASEYLELVRMVDPKDVVALLYSLAQDQSTRGGASVEESADGEGGGWTFPAQEEENQEGTQDCRALSE